MFIGPRSEGRDMAHWGVAVSFYYVCKQVTHSTCPRGIWKSCIVVFSLLGCGDLASICRLKDDVTSSFGTSDINCIRHFELSHTAAFGPVAARFHLAKSLKSYWNCCYQLHMHTAQSTSSGGSWSCQFARRGNHCRHRLRGCKPLDQFHLLINSLCEQKMIYSASSPGLPQTL